MRNTVAKIAVALKQREKRKMVLFLLFSLCAVYLFLIPIQAEYGRFYDGTGARDTVYMNVATFDTLGYQANADTVIFTRWYGGTLVDSTTLTGVGTKTGYYVTPKRAFDGTHYGSYNVDVRWNVQGKNFHKEKSYTVFPDSVTGVARLQTNQDKTNYDLDANYLTKADSGSTGTSYLRTKYLEDKTGIALTSAYFTKADSGSTAASYLRTKYLEDKTGIALTASYLTKGDSGATGASYLRAKYLEDKTEIQDIQKVLVTGNNYRELFYYNGSGKLDSVRAYNGAVLISRQIYWRPTAASAPDSVRFYTY